MTICRIPQTVSALLFDMDNTLYTNQEYVRFQLESPVRRLAEIKNTTFAEMQREIAEYRKTWAASNPQSGAPQAGAHGKAQAQVSLGNIFLALGIPIEETVRWREELYEPAQYLKRDPKLRDTLTALAASFSLAVVTNNPVLVARKTLAALGVEDLFGVLVGLDTCGVSKPHKAPFLKAAELLGAPPETCVSIGDRYDIDIALPLELGMGGILVDGVEDVYSLCSVQGALLNS
ncbi:MAG: HAD family hydrolase [Treponema sp.]|jgi:phosphoglycolate phosphatase/putative hydrolase of the HAD superfamily|nr:HAD family hydrolase [Treponema sp.]